MTANDTLINNCSIKKLIQYQQGKKSFNELWNRGIKIDGFINAVWICSFPLVSNLIWGRKCWKMNFFGGIFYVTENDSSCWDFYMVDNRESAGAGMSEKAWF